MADSLRNWRLPSPNTTYSNFQSILNSFTPKVSSLYPSEARGKDTACYLLADLWNSYAQQSFYGAGVPILLESGETTMQYYSPSLSAMQIYTCESFDSRRLGRSSSSKFKSDSWSESHDSLVPLSNRLSRTLDTTSDDSTIDQTIGRFGYLYYQYNETSSPYDRVPLYRKIWTLAQNYHGLFNFRSVDLSPYSWVAIAWYPIYQIPFVGNMKDLAACFITYHTLSTCFQETGHPLSGISGREEKPEEGSSRRFKLNGNEISLPPFAVSTYKVFGDLWKNPRTSDRADITYYNSAAASWLRELRFQHSDFNFFSSR